MIYLTGDTHCPYDMAKLNSRRFPQQKALTRDDYVIICGDFGCVWYGNNEDRYWLDWLESKRFTTLFLDGNHENFALLNRYPSQDWHDGRVRRIREHVLHLTRGQLYTLEGLSFFTLGGASSHDTDVRKPFVNWWPQELPSQQELDLARLSLNLTGWRVDFVLTHCAPTAIQSQLRPDFAPDRLTDFLQTLEDKLTFHHWYFGHYHLDCEPDAHHSAVFDRIIPITKE